MISSVRDFVVRILDTDRFTIVLFQILDIKSNYLPVIVHSLPDDDDYDEDESSDEEQGTSNLSNAALNRQNKKKKRGNN
jgi:hypothetical protein